MELRQALIKRELNDESKYMEAKRLIRAFSINGAQIELQIVWFLKKLSTYFLFKTKNKTKNKTKQNKQTNKKNNTKLIYNV